MADRSPGHDAERGGRRPVEDPLFVEYPAFFSTEDGVQLKYEMLRRHHVDGLSVVEAARRFGYSRQGFYLVDAAFRSDRMQGLLPGRPGPKGPRKVTPEMAAFLRSRHRERPDDGFAQLADAAAGRFGIRVHPRTVRRLLAKKKLTAPEAPPGTTGSGVSPGRGPDPTGV
jgi:transposase